MFAPIKPFQPGDYTRLNWLTGDDNQVYGANSQHLWLLGPFKGYEENELFITLIIFNFDTP